MENVCSSNYAKRWGLVLTVNEVVEAADEEVLASSLGPASVRVEIHMACTPDPFSLTPFTSTVSIYITRLLHLSHVVL